MKFSRRALVRTGVVSGGIGASGALPGSATAAPQVRRVATLRQVLTRGSARAGGYRLVSRAAGERHKVRTDLGIKPKKGRAKRRTGVFAFAQISDVHIVDAQSPLRLEFTDRFDDKSVLPTQTGIFSSAHRPHEMLSGHVADAMVRAINKIKTGPVTGKPLALTIQTGDNSDNSQRNEIRWNIDLLDGGTVRMDSGDLTKWEGVADDDPLYYDPAYWHPHAPPAGKARDNRKVDSGFPTVPGLLDAARRPFTAAGLNMPWYSAFGNHDGLAQGNFPQTLQLSTVATGNLKIISPPLGISPADLINKTLTDFPGLLSSLAVTPSVRLVSPDPNRKLLTRKQIVEEHFTTKGAPLGHGFTAANRANGTAYYFFDKSIIRFIVLDTVNPNGYSNGSIDQAQMDWLTELLKHSAHRMVMIFSHHTSYTMNNPLVVAGGELGPRVMGKEVLKLLLDNWEVVAWINGHTHKNKITAHKRPKGGGLWEINTAAHIDWPQQARLIEVADNRDGTHSLFTTMVDHEGPAAYGGRLDSPVNLAGLSREICANDWQDRSDVGLGTRIDRNCELVVKTPPRLRRFLIAKEQR